MNISAVHNLGAPKTDMSCRVVPSGEQEIRTSCVYRARVRLPSRLAHVVPERDFLKRTPVRRTCRGTFSAIWNAARKPEGFGPFVFSSCAEGSLLERRPTPFITAPPSCMPVPNRFDTATFEKYEPRTPSQREALRAARDAVRRTRRSPSWTQRLMRVLGKPTDRSAGLYLVGPAGTGKTHLLAAMYHALTPEVSCAFLHSSTLFRQTEPPTAFANRLADAHDVCCLDEVEIDDPANEMRLVQVMKTLVARDVRLLATSNVEPEEYLSNQFSDGRFQRFLQREFRARYRVVPVHGRDYRRRSDVQQSGHGWIGPSSDTHRAMSQAYAKANGSSRWWPFEQLLHRSTEVPHTTLVDSLSTLDHLFVEGIRIGTTDDALRLLRLIDALYLHSDTPDLYFTSEQPPDAWFDPDGYAGVAEGVAEKFERTVSRIHALCTLHGTGTPEDSPGRSTSSDPSGREPHAQDGRCESEA